MPGHKRYVVPSLQSLAFMVSYKNIFKNLSRVNDDEVPMLEDNQPAFYDASLSGTISFIRARLSQHLVGTMNDDIRYTFIPFKIIKILNISSV